MSTEARIEVPYSNYEHFGVDSDGYPSEMVEYLEDIVERAKEKAEKKYKNPEENWHEQLQLELENLTEDYYTAELIKNYRGGGEYTYKITENGDVLYKEGNGEWQEWEK